MQARGSTLAHPTAARAPRTALVPVVALVGSMTSLCVGTSYARTLFAGAGAAGTTTLRITIAALLPCLLRRRWRRPLGRRDLGDVAICGAILMGPLTVARRGGRPSCRARCRTRWRPTRCATCRGRPSACCRSLEPAIGSLAGLALLGQHLALQQWMAIGRIIAASAGSTPG